MNQDVAVLRVVVGVKPGNDYSEAVEKLKMYGDVASTMLEIKAILLKTLVRCPEGWGGGQLVPLGTSINVIIKI